MKRHKDAPSRHELTEHGEGLEKEMEKQEVLLDRIVSDVETVRQTLENLDFSGTSEGTDEIERSIEGAENVTVQEFDREDESLEEIQADNEEFERGLQDRHGASESDLGKISDSKTSIETKETIDKLTEAREAAERDIDFLTEQIERARSAMENSDAVQEKLKSRVNTDERR